MSFPLDAPTNAIEAEPTEPLDAIPTPSQNEKREDFSLPDVQLQRNQHGYSVDRENMYRNSLMWQVGLLELTNALDFPANVWNQIPIPLFAIVLMGMGGSIAILWSIFAFWDMHKAIKNIELLKEERRFLKSWQNRYEDEDINTRCLVQAWLDVNLRELGWEIIDRVMLDICSGISGVLVGTGALMAIRGDLDAVFQASNLLSGYVGNSFLAPFALANSFWAVFMFMRAGGELQALTKGKYQVDAELQTRMRHHGRKHKLYAVINGLTAIAGSVGSIMSSTLWYGYLIIVPCVFTSVYCNWLWRHQMGYDRPMARRKEDLQFDVLHILQAILGMIAVTGQDSTERLACETKPYVLRTLIDTGLYESFCCSIRNALSDADGMTLKQSGTVVIDTTSITQLDQDTVIKTAQDVMSAERCGILRSRERFLIELYGRYFQGLEHYARHEKVPG